MFWRSLPITVGMVYSIPMMIAGWFCHPPGATAARLQHERPAF